MSTGLFFGLTTIDCFNVIPQHPSANQKVRAERQFVSAGGPATNAAVTFAAFGNDTRLCSGLGRHPVAELGISDLRQHGVTLYDFALIPDELPVLSSILIDSSNGNRCVVYADSSLKRLQSDIPCDELLHDCRVALFDGYYIQQAVIAAYKAKECGIITVLDGGSWKNGLDELLPFIDYAICSDDFVPPGCTSVADIFAYLIKRGASHCAVSRGPDSVLAAVEGNRIDIAVSAVNAVDTLGAGDVLHGAFCHYITDHPFRESLQLAAHTASQSCRYYGTREWIHHL